MLCVLISLYILDYYGKGSLNSRSTIFCTPRPDGSCGLFVNRIPAGPSVCHPGCAYTVLQTIQMPGTRSVNETLDFPSPLGKIQYYGEPPHLSLSRGKAASTHFKQLQVSGIPIIQSSRSTTPAQYFNSVFFVVCFQP